MTKHEKLIEKILNGKNVSYEEVEAVLRKFGFELEIKGSHHVFRKNGYHRNVSIKRRKLLLPYQIRDVKEVIRDHE